MARQRVLVFPLLFLIVEAGVYYRRRHVVVVPRRGCAATSPDAAPQAFGDSVNDRLPPIPTRRARDLARLRAALGRARPRTG